jgi:hypothetical protein
VNGTLPRLPVVAPQSAPVPRAAPVKSPPVPTPRAVPIAAPKKAKVSSAGACSVAYKVYNGATDQFVADIAPNGTVVDPPCAVNIEAVISCDQTISSPVTLILRRVADQKLVQSQTEAAWPYFLFGNNGDDVYSGRIGKAQFNIQVRSSDATIDTALPAEGTFFRMGQCV